MAKYADYYHLKKLADAWRHDAARCVAAKELAPHDMARNLLDRQANTYYTCASMLDGALLVILERLQESTEEID